MSASAPATPSRTLATYLGYAVAALGAAGVLGYVLGLAERAGLPEVVRYASLATAALEIGLGLGVAARRRGAWAFAIALEATITLFNLISLPHLAKAWPLGGVAIAFAVARAALLVLLVNDADEF